MCNRRDILHTVLGFLAMKWDEINVFGIKGKELCLFSEILYVPLSLKTISRFI